MTHPTQTPEYKAILAGALPESVLSAADGFSYFLTFILGPALVLWLRECLVNDSATEAELWALHTNLPQGKRYYREPEEIRRAILAAERYGLVSPSPLGPGVWVPGRDLDTLGVICELSPQDYEDHPGQWS